MKTVLLSLILSFPLFLNGDDEPIDYDRLEKREVNGEVLLFIVDSKNPFTGITTTSRYENGQKRGALGFKAGKQEGLSTRWYKNGQKKSEGYMTDTKYSGSYKSWYENGQKETEIIFVEGTMHGASSGWFKNGQMKSEVIFKEGKLNGGVLNWHENGQKRREATYKDGVLISENFWNKKGEEVDSKEEAEQ